MIKMIRENRRSIVGTVLLLALSASMLLFGTDPINKGSDAYAIKIDDITVSNDEFYQKRQELEQNLEQRLGPNYYQLLDAGVININQQVMDSLLDQLLLSKFALDLGTGVGNNELSNYIRRQFSPNGSLDMNLYANYLANQRMTAPQFEARIRGILVAANTENIIRDATRATNAEAKAKMKSDLTAYDASYLEIDPKNYVKKVGEITEDEMLSYYEENAVNFELPAKAEYEYVVITPDKVMEKVEILEDDIELYYLEHQSDYQDPAKITASHIQINFTTDSSPEKVAEIKARAEEVHNKVQAGEDIASLVLEYSDDITTKALGGSLGTFSSGTHGAELEKAAFALTEPGLAPLVETDYGFHVVYVDEIKQPEARPLDEVRGGIKTAIIERDAPAYARVEAEELFDKALAGSLTESAKETGFEIKKTEGVVDASQDPDTALAGLSKLVLNSPGDTVQIHDFADNSIVVNVLSYEEANIPDFEKVKDKVTAIISEQKAVKLAKMNAEEILAEVSSEKNLSTIAKEKKLSIKVAKGMKRSEQSTDIFSNPQLREALFSAGKENQVPNQVIAANGKFYIVQASKITPPAASEDNKDLNKYKNEQSQYLAQVLRSSLISVLKQESEIDIDESLLVN